MREKKKVQCLHDLSLSTWRGDKTCRNRPCCSRDTVHRRIPGFQGGKRDIGDEPRSGAPKPAIYLMTSHLIADDPRTSIHDVSCNMLPSTWCTYRISHEELKTETGMCKVSNSLPDTVIAASEWRKWYMLNRRLPLHFQNCKGLKDWRCHRRWHFHKRLWHALKTDK